MKSFFAHRRALMIVIFSAGAAASLLVLPATIGAPHLVMASLLLIIAGVFLGFALQRDSWPAARANVANVSAPDLQTSSLTRTPPHSAPANALLEATMNSMREGVLVIDHELQVVASNRAAEGIFRHLSGPIESLRLSELTRNSAIHTAFLAAVNDNQRAEVKVETSGTDRRVLELRVVPLRFERETSTRGAIGVFFDITRLERLERVRQEFLSNVSHELRTPLTAIIAFVETLEDGAIDDPEHNRRFLGVIRKNASRMHNLIDDILELSAIEAGTVRVEPTHVRLQPIVNDVIAALATRSDARRLSVQNTVAPDVFIFADPRRLEQMLTNLVDNAIKFNREGGSVSISHEAAGARAKISVSDNGDGISAEHIERIFERFYRVDRARSREMGGTGLGLAIVKHLARAHGGEASVTSTLGSGSTFTIELQSSPPAAALPPSSQTTPHPSSSSPAHLDDQSAEAAQAHY
ncbi:MAG: ATP-binding protein [Pyrinomonadaceae bacterium]